MTLIEVCVEGSAAVKVARDEGADRVELCRDLFCGGLTPPMEVIEEALRCAPPEGLRILVREKPDSFELSEREMEEQARLISEIRQRFADSPVPVGFVVGGLRRGRLDFGAARSWREAAGDAALIFHRGFDEIPDSPRALDDLHGLGFQGVLTAGSTTGVADVEVLRNLVEEGQRLGGMSIVGSGGLRAQNVAQVIEAARLTEVHFRAPYPDGEGTDPEVVRRTVAAIRAAA